MTKTTSAAATVTAGPNVATTLDAREMERALAEPWGAMRCASAYDEDLVEGIKNRFAIMTPFARRGAIGAALFASRRGANFARELARSVGSEDADEWVRALSSAVTSDEWIFDLSGLDSSVPAVRQTFARVATRENSPRFGLIFERRLPAPTTCDWWAPLNNPRGLFLAFITMSERKLTE